VAKLTEQERNRLPDSAFALSGRRYPIHDIEHAREALRMAAAHGTPEEKAEVRRKVHKRYPEIAIAEEREKVRKGLR
jgi:hypothetical protein